MSGRGVRAPAGVLGAAAVLAVSAAVGGCSPDGPAASPTPSRVSTSAAPPVGSVGRPRPVTCADGATRTPGVPTAAASPGTRTTPPERRSAPTRSARAWDPSDNDLRIGPLTLRGVRALDDGSQSFHGVHNAEGWHYVLGVAVKAGVDVTVTIGAEQRARAGLEFGGAQGTTPAPAVTFHGCAGDTTSFLGAFFIAGDGRACLPLEIRVGDGVTRRVVISFYKGRCPA